MKKSKSIKKVSTLLLIFFSTALIIAIAGCVDQTPSTNSTTTTPGQTATPNLTVANITIQTSVQSTPATNATIKCELCHTNPQNLPPHMNGGKLCVNCHGSQVHSIHIGQGTINLECQTCHGFPPTVPTVKKGTGPGTYSVCERCHAPPPNSTQPSNGNLIVIHLSRGKYCTNCHGSDIAAIHAGIIANTTKSG